MKKLSILILLIISSLCLNLNAQNPDRNHEQWLSEMRELKHDFLARQLKLSAEQREKFFDIYDRMDEEMNRVQAEAKAAESRIYDADASAITEADYDEAINAQLALKEKESEIEKQAYEELKTVLTKKQLFELKKAERDFTMQIMRQHRRISRDKK